MKPWTEKAGHKQVYLDDVNAEGLPKGSLSSLEKTAGLMRVGYDL